MIHILIYDFLSWLLCNYFDSFINSVLFECKYLIIIYDSICGYIEYIEYESGDDNILIMWKGTPLDIFYR